LSGRTWHWRPYDAETVRHLCQRFALGEVTARLLAARGITLADTDDFLAPKLKRWLPEPLSLRDMAAGVARLVRAVTTTERVAVLADYDVDGATGAALLTRFLASVGLPTRLYIPDRLTEGYGPGVGAIERLHGEGITLVITVDCGVNAFAALERAASLGLDVIVVDHHQPPPRLPPAIAQINPNRADDDSGLGHLAAVGVAFLLVVATNRALREAGWYRPPRGEPDLRRWLDLVALGTLCDMVPLIGLNRAFVRQGLAVASLGGNPGLARLAERLKLGGAMTAYRFAFLIGPRINAGGRVGQADLGARLLITDDDAEAAALAARLDDLNRERQRLERQTLAAALGGVLAVGREAGLIWAEGDDWHPGVIGIVAARLVDHFLKPAVVVTRRNGLATASARSVAGFDLGAAVKAAANAALLLKGGGHAMAAGFSCESTKLPELRAFLEGIAAAATPVAARRLEIDGPLSLAAVSPQLAETIDGCAPFGNGNPEPRFVFRSVTVDSLASVAPSLTRCHLVDLNGERRQAVLFASEHHPLTQPLRALGQRHCHVAARLRHRGANHAVELLIDDVATDADG
jgi:single-stranded-DNA-specific exonuclease